MSWSDDSLFKAMREILPAERILTGSAVQRAYASDAYTVEKFFPTLVALPESTEEVARICRWCHLNEVPLTPRGAGTGLSGGAMPALGGMVLSTKKMTKILEIDVTNRAALVQSGVPNAKVSQAVAGHDLHFAPDPSSQSVSTIGGNIAENSGGPHTLKYGVTAQHVLGLKMVCGDGEVLELGSKHGPDPSLDLMSLVVGSEGMLGVVTEAWLRLTPNPIRTETALVAFPTIRSASESVAAIVKSGVMPAALEMMDANVLVAVAAAFELAYPQGTAAMLLVETDGETEQAKSEIERIVEICREKGCLSVEIAKDDEHRKRLWIARKKGIGALGRIAPSVVTHDGVIPPSKLPDMLEFVYQVAEKLEMGVANIFHAGDGNLHPIFYFDEREEGQIEKVIEAGERVIGKCIELGGSVSGEHGIGVEKAVLLARMFDEESLALQGRVASAFYEGASQNPCKVVPSGKSCVEHRMRWRGVAT